MLQSLITILMSFFAIYYFFSQNFKEIHHLLTDDEREMIFGHPFVEYGGYHCMKAVLK